MTVLDENLTVTPSDVCCGFLLKNAAVISKLHSIIDGINPNFENEYTPYKWDALKTNYCKIVNQYKAKLEVKIQLIKKELTAILKQLFHRFLPFTHTHKHTSVIIYHDCSNQENY